MAAKRFFEDSDNDSDQPNHKRMKPTKHSLASVIKEVVTLNFLDNFCSALEPMLRRVVNEEVENGLKRNLRSLTRAPSLRIQAIDEPPSLQLIFPKKLSLPIFTGSKIKDIDGNHLQIILVDTRGDGMVPTSLPHSVKIEIVVLDGDFPSGDDLDKWTNEEFDKYIVKERAGKRPLLSGELNVTMRDGLTSIGDIEFTDNSSWIRSRRFRLGAKVVQGTSSSQVARIRPALTESFIVKDHRGELYKKHYPPALHDEVWRLEKIGKDGAFHRKLSAEGIHTVHDFLKLSVVDSLKLRKILGIGMSEKMWDGTLKHAWTCEMGTKLYISRGSNYIIILNPVCQVIKAVINGQLFANRDLTMMHKAYIEKLVKDAYSNWKTLEEVDGQVNEAALLILGEYVDQYPNQQQKIGSSNQGGHALLTDGSIDQLASIANNEQVEYNEWAVNCGYLSTPVESNGRYFSESSSEDDLR